MPTTLLASADRQLTDDVLRLAATLGVGVAVEPDPAAARRLWSAAPAVLVGADAAPACLAAGVPRRGATFLLSREPVVGEALWRLAVALGAETVLALPGAEGDVADVLADAADDRGGGAVTVGVVGGRGGAGASTLAVALALTGIRRGHSTLLVDADPLGGGIDLLLGQEDEPGLRWPDLAASRGRISAGALDTALPHPYGLGVVSADRRTGAWLPPEAMAAVLGAAVRANDLVVVDLPRRADDAALVALERIGTVLLVVPAEVRACAGAAQVATLIAAGGADLRLVVREPGPAGLDADLVARTLGLSLAGRLRTDRRLPAVAERGEPPALGGRGALAGLCMDLLAVLLPPAPRGIAA